MKTLHLQGECLVIGPDSIDYLQQVPFKKAYIITGGGSMERTGVIARVKDCLASRGEIALYSGIQKNPTTADIMEAMQPFASFAPDLVIAVGGGSAIDAAKIMTLLYEYPHLNFDNIFSEALPSRRLKTTFVAIPSTSGTGTEVTNVSVVTFPQGDLKRGIASESLRPDLAILDGNLPTTLPKSIVAQTGIDALTHALECYINRNVDDFTEVIAKGAIEGILAWLPISYEKGDLQSRQKMHNYQCMAGMAFSNAGLGMVHGISHAIGGRYNLAHGLTNAVVLPYSMDYNKRDPWVAARYASLTQSIGKDIIQSVKDLNASLDIPRCFQDVGIAESRFKEDFPLLVQNCLMGSTRVNPIPVPQEDMQKILECVYYAKAIDF